MFETPSSDVSFLASPGPDDVLSNMAQRKSDACAPCVAFSAPARPASSSGGHSWLYLFMLMVGTFLVAYGVFKIFKASAEGRRSPKSWGYAAPHVTAGGTPPVYQPTAVESSGIEESNPDKIIPDPSDAQVTFVFFHATWCGHCKQFKPIFEQVAAAAKGKARFKTVVSDVLQKSPHADKIPIRGFPTIIVFSKGEQVDTLVGNQGKDALEQLVMKHAK